MTDRTITPPEITDADRLERLASLAAALELPRTRDDALAAAARVAEGQFYVACVGQFKRGKSTLIDALLDDPVLPAGIVPVTAVPTVVRFGEQRSARVRTMIAEPSKPRTNDALAWEPIAPDDLPKYVSEELNPGNERLVAGVEVFVPIPLLRSGMCLVDTPGLGSVFEQNSVATRAFVPHIDAAVVVVGADPPVSGDELDLIEDVARHVRELIVVMNKSDRVTAEERRVASEFAREVIARRIRRPVERIYEVSATERLARSGPPRDWDALVAALETLAQTAGQQLVGNAAERAVKRVGAVLYAAIREERDALVRPGRESDARIERLGAVIADGERAMLDLGPLFTLEQHRLARRFADERAAFLRDALPPARERLAHELSRMRGWFGPALRRAMMHLAQDTARRFLDPWFARQQAHAEEAYREAMMRFTGLGAAFLDRLAESGVPELQTLRGALDAAPELHARSRFVFNEVITVAQPASPLRFLADVAVGVVNRNAIERAATRFLEWLLEMNSSRVESDVDQRAAESRRALEAQIRSLLRELTANATRAIARARAAHAAGAGTVQDALDRLRTIERTLDEILASASRTAE